MIDKSDIINKVLSGVITVSLVGGAPWLFTLQMRITSASNAIESMEPTVTANKEAVIRMEERFDAVNDKLDDIRETQRATLRAIQHLEEEE